MAHVPPSSQIQCNKMTSSPLTGFSDIFRSGVPLILILQYLTTSRWMSFMPTFVEYLIMSGWLTFFIIISTYIYTFGRWDCTLKIKKIWIIAEIMTLTLGNILVRYPCLSIDCISSYENTTIMAILSVMVILRMIITCPLVMMGTLAGVRPYSVNGVQDHILISDDGRYMLGYGSVYNFIINLTPHRGDVAMLVVIWMMIDHIATGKNVRSPERNIELSREILNKLIITCDESEKKGKNGPNVDGEKVNT